MDFNLVKEFNADFAKIEEFKNFIENCNNKYKDFLSFNFSIENIKKIKENVPVETNEKNVPVEIPDLINENNNPDLINNPVAAAPKIKTYNCEVCRYYGKDLYALKRQENST